MLFFLNDTATTEIYTLSLHDALPICHHSGIARRLDVHVAGALADGGLGGRIFHDARLRAVVHRTRVAILRIEARVRWTTARKDRKSTRLNSSHLVISYAVFCLKKKQI